MDPKSPPAAAVAISNEDFQLAANVPVPMLLTVEDGAARLMYARLIHQAGSRRLGPFLTVSFSTPSGAAGPPWAFDLRRSFERARGGTLFVDDVALMGLGDQGVLSGLIEAAWKQAEPDGPAVRIIAGASRSLSRAVAAGTFDPALFYRLNVIHLERAPGLR